MNFGMKNSIILFLLIIPSFLFAQYPNSGNKARLGYQTTGDGLIWRGVAADTAIKPRTTANAYFQLDTVNRILRRYIATQGSWQVVGGGSVNIDSLIYATRYWVGSNFFPLEGGTLTGTGGAGFIGLPSQVTAPGTPASGLNIYAQGSGFNWKGTDGHERFFASTLTGGRTYMLPDISGTFALGTGTADRSGRWTGTNTLGAGSWSDNLTRLQAQVPVQFQSVTTAGLPTGVTGYHLYNTTTNGPAWYQGSRWAYGLESTFNRGTATRIPFFNANGQVTDDASFYRSSPITWSIIDSDFSGFSAGESSSKYGGIFWRNATEYLTITTSANQPVKIENGSTLSVRDNTNTRWDVYATGTRTVGLGLIRDADFYGMEMGESSTKTGGFYWRNSLERLNITTFGNGFPIEFGSNWAYMAIDGKIGMGNTSPQRKLDVTGEIRISDLTTDTPTRIVGADADGDLADITWLVPLSTSSLGIGITPTENLDINGDLRVRDSTRLTTTPAHSAITGLLTRDATGWVGKARLGTDFIYAGDSIRLASAGNGIISALPLGNVAIAAAGNSLTIGGMSELTLGGTSWEIYSDDFETDIYNAEYAEIAAGTGAKVTLDNTSELVEITGNVTALRESYYEINTTTSPATFSSSIPDNFVNQGGTQASFTFLFPASPADGQILSITWGNAVSTLTLDGNGNTITGSAVTTAVAGTRRQFKYYTSAATWIKIY